MGTGAVDLAAANASTDSDLLNITSGNFTKGTGSVFTFDFWGMGSTGWHKLADWTGTTTFTDGDFNATNLTSGLSGSFTSAVFLNVVPEPSTFAMLLGGGAAMLAFQRARRRRRN